MRQTQTLKSLAAGMFGGIVGVLLLGWTYTYDTSTPPDTGESPTLGARRIREIKQALQERLNIDHVWPLTGTEVSSADAGKHRQVRIAEPQADPTAATDETVLYTKDVSGKAELYILHEDDVKTRLTDGGYLYIDPNTVFAAGVVDSNAIGNSAITSAKIPDGTILSADIADANILSANLGPSSVTTAKIADANITAAKLAVGAAYRPHSGAAVFSDSVATSFGTTVLDLSGIVGANAALVVLKCSPDALRTLHAKPSSEAGSWGSGAAMAGAATCAVGNGANGILICPTDSTGKIGLATNLASTWTIYLLGYLK